ncbi:ferritin family protein [Chloroflexota bacterium]
MSISFSGSELLNIAVGIERRGIAFYDIMTRSADSDAARDTFQHLADMEREHIHIFQDMLSDVDKYQPSATSIEEYADYLRALIDSAVFTDAMITSEMATDANSDIRALELGISAEKDSILFYYVMKDMMPRGAQPAVNKIIAEEKTHLRQLSELKKKLAAI